MIHSRPFKINVSLFFSLFFSLSLAPQASAQLSKFNRVYPTGSNPANARTSFNAPGFAETNAVSWTKPVDVTGVTTIATTRQSVSITLDPNRTAGILSGGRFSYPDGGAISTDLTSVTFPILNPSGLLEIPANSTGFTANQGDNWRYNAEMKQADFPNTATGIGVLGAGKFSSQEGESSVLNQGSINILPTGLVANPGQGAGTKVTMQVYTERTTNTNNRTIEYSETGEAFNEFQGNQFLNQSDSKNNTATFDASTASDQAARNSRYTVREDGAGAAVASGGFTNPGNNAIGTLGDAIPLNGFIPNPGRKVLRNRAGENAEAMTVTSLANAGPNYADKTTTAGGNNASAITYTNFNDIATGNNGGQATTQMTTCTAAAFDCGGQAVGSTRAPYIRVLSDGSFSAFY